MEQEYFSGSMAYITPIHAFSAFVGPEAFTSATVFKKHGGEASSGWRDRYILNKLIMSSLTQNIFSLAKPVMNYSNMLIQRLLVDNPWQNTTEKQTMMSTLGGF